MRHSCGTGGATPGLFQGGGNTWVAIALGVQLVTRTLQTHVAAAGRSGLPVSARAAGLYLGAGHTAAGSTLQAVFGISRKPVLRLRRSDRGVPVRSDSFRWRARPVGFHAAAGGGSVRLAVDAGQSPRVRVEQGFRESGCSQTAARVRRPAYRGAFAGAPSRARRDRYTTASRAVRK